MKNKLSLYIFIGLITTILSLNSVCYAKENITLNKAKTDDVEHTFKYPDLVISNDIKPYSITLSIENGYFNTNNEKLNEAVSTYFDFKGGTNTANAYISNLETSQNYKVITFNIKSSVDLNESTTKKNLITSIRDFLRDITFYNETDKDAKFTLTFSERELKLTNESAGINGIDIIAFKDPDQPKEHYYAKILSSAIHWDEAYKKAASLKWNGMQGYLVTITSEAEHNFIYQSLGSIKGWMGAASIENYDSIKYNTQNITWNSASDKLLGGSKGTGYAFSDSENDKNIRKYWRWVAGPEAGQQIFKEGSYSNFTNGEPNNYNTIEWCGEYGHGDGGKWNDYPTNPSDIQGYYIEFGGFDEEPETKPVSLVNTFKWKDYDFRNIGSIINDKIDTLDLNKEISEETFQELIDEAIVESEIEKTTSTIKNKTIKNGNFILDIEINIGEGEETTTYVLHVKRKLNIDNPKTVDNIKIYMTMMLVSITGILYSIEINKRKKI